MSSQLVRPVQDILEDMKPSTSSKAYDVAYESNMSSQLVRPVQDIIEDMKPSKSSKVYDLDYENFVNIGTIQDYYHPFSSYGIVNSHHSSGRPGRDFKYLKLQISITLGKCCKIKENLKSQLQCT